MLRVCPGDVSLDYQLQREIKVSRRKCAQVGKMGLSSFEVMRGAGMKRLL